MKPGLKKSFDDLFESFEYFKQNLKKAKEKHEKELIVQRFDFILDAFLKNIRLFLKEQSYNCVYADECIKAAAKFGLIVSENIVLEMLDDKYRLSILKNQKIPDEIYQRIKLRYTIILGKSFDKIKEYYFLKDNSKTKSKKV